MDTGQLREALQNRDWAHIDDHVARLLHEHDVPWAELADSVSAQSLHAWYGPTLWDDRNSHPPVVYFITTTDHVKIGTTRQIGTRLEYIAAHSPLPVQLAAVTPGGPAIESRYHQWFARWHLHHEWFQRAPIIDTVMEICTINNQPILERLNERIHDEATH